MSIISLKLAAEMALELKTWGGPSIVMVNGQRTPPLGRVELTIKIDNTTIQANVLVLEMRGINLLLGNDVLRRFKKLQIEYGTGKPKMRFGDLPVQMAIEDPTPSPRNKIIAKTGVTIPARSMVAMEIEQSEATRPTEDGRPWMLEPTKRRGPTPGRALIPGDRPATCILVTNLEHRPVYIHKKTVLGFRTEVTGEGTDLHSTNEGATAEKQERPWRSLIPIDNIANHVTPGKNSQEREKQSSREKSTPQIQYVDGQTLPDFPSEAEPETLLEKINNTPTSIPLDDVTGNPKSVYDHQHRPWPEAKTGTHHNVAVYTSTTTAPDKAEEAPKDFDFKPSINQDCPEEERADIEETL